MKKTFSNTGGLQKTVEAILADYHRQGYFPSGVVRVFSATETLCEACIGGVTQDTVFDVASLTKIATATQILLLMDQGKLSLEDDILTRLPQLAEDALLRSRLAKVTLRQLLTHTSGIVDWYPFYAEKGSFAQVLSIALSRYGPVEGMVYSDPNFMLLGKVLEATAGQPLDVALGGSLVQPYSLGRMTYHPDPAWDIAPSSYGNPIEEDMCRQRGIAFSGWREHTPLRAEANDGNAYYYFDGVAGSAGIFADAAAYQKLCQLYLTTPSPLLLRSQEKWAPTRGLGWQRGPMYPDGCGHTGFTGTSLYLSRSAGLGVVAFTNRLFYEAPNPHPTNDFRSALHHAVFKLLTSSVNG